MRREGKGFRGILNDGGKMASLRNDIWVKHGTADKAGLAISASAVTEPCKVPQAGVHSDTVGN